MEYLTVFITVAIAHFLAVISPEPDFIMITRNSFLYSRKTGVYSALGLGLGILVHVTYSLIGLGLLISQSIVLFSHGIIKNRVTKIQHFAERFIGIILIALGIKLALSSAKYINIKITKPPALCWGRITSKRIY